MRRILLLPLLISAGLPAQQVPLATELPAKPFFIRATWFIGGAGNWDYLTMDSQAGRLYIAHGTSMQVVDVNSGDELGEIGNFYEARQVALDDTGQLGYISDGGQGKVVVFDRQTLKKVAEIDTGANPRSLVYDPLTKLLFVVRANPPAEEPAAPAGRRPAAAREGSPAEASTQSKVTVIDTQTQTAIGEIAFPGLLGYAVADENDDIYVAVTDRNEVYRFDAQTVAAQMRPQPEAGAIAVDNTVSSKAKKEAAAWTVLDWTGTIHSPNPADGRLRSFNLSPECADPRSLAIDSIHLRVFAACNNRRLVVLNTGTGEKVTSLPIGPDVDAVGYDAEHGLIFTANGGAEGSLTIIHQDVTDTYAVIQTLPTRQRASTLAVDPQSGAVYLVTDYQGVDLSHPGGIGTLHQEPVKGSFQVLQISD